MNEELKMVLDAVKTLGSEGKTAFIVWIVCWTIEPLFVGLGFCVVIWTVFASITRMVKNIGKEKVKKAINEASDVMATY